MTLPDRTIVEADSRGRVSLAKLGIKDAQLTAERTEDGGVILTPAVVVTPAEARYYRNPEAIELLSQAQESVDNGHVEQGKLRSKPS